MQCVCDGGGTVAATRATSEGQMSQLPEAHRRQDKKSEPDSVDNESHSVVVPMYSLLILNLTSLVIWFDSLQQTKGWALQGGRGAARS